MSINSWAESDFRQDPVPGSQKRSPRTGGPLARLPFAPSPLADLLPELEHARRDVDAAELRDVDEHEHQGDAGELHDVDEHARRFADAAELHGAAGFVNGGNGFKTAINFVNAGDRQA